MLSPVLGVFELVPRAYGEIIGGGVGIGSGVSMGLLALGIPTSVGHPFLEGAYAAVLLPFSAVLFLHGWRPRKRKSLGLKR